MAKNLFNPMEDPPSASSSEDNEVEISSEKDEEQISNSSSFQENESKDPSTKTLKTSNQDSDSDFSPAVKSGKKRASEGTTKGKRVKKYSTALFQRIWSEEDELSLLQGMIDFKAETGTSPYDEMNEFYDIVKEYISFDVSKAQFCEKIRFLKRKYVVKKRVVNSSHDKKCLGLAKYIWVSHGMALESAVKLKKIEKKVEESDYGKLKNLDKEVMVHGSDSESTNWFEESFLVRSIVSLGVDEYSVKQKWSKVAVETKKRIEEKLKLVNAKEIELLLQKTDILKEVTSVISEAT